MALGPRPPCLRARPQRRGGGFCHSGPGPGGARRAAPDPGEPPGEAPWRSDTHRPADGPRGETADGHEDRSGQAAARAPTLAGGRGRRGPPRGRDPREDPPTTRPAQREDGPSPIPAGSSGAGKGRLEASGRTESWIPSPRAPSSLRAGRQGARTGQRASARPQRRLPGPRSRPRPTPSWRHGQRHALQGGPRGRSGPPEGVSARQADPAARASPTADTGPRRPARPVRDAGRRARRVPRRSPGGRRLRALGVPRARLTARHELTPNTGPTRTPLPPHQRPGALGPRRSPPRALQTPGFASTFAEGSRTLTSTNPARRGSHTRPAGAAPRGRAHRA